MKTRLLVVAAMAVACLSMGGCGKKDEVSMKANAICEAYVAKMEAGQTTAEQDKAFIKAVRGVVFELDRSIRGKKKAEATRDAARQAITTGVDPNAPFKLFDDIRDGPKDDESQEQGE